MIHLMKSHMFLAQAKVLAAMQMKALVIVLTMMIQYTPLQTPAVIGTLHLTTEQEPMNQYVQEM